MDAEVDIEAFHAPDDGLERISALFLSPELVVLIEDADSGVMNARADEDAHCHAEEGGVTVVLSEVESRRRQVRKRWADEGIDDKADIFLRRAPWSTALA
jgi:hypothetical protein